MSKAKKLVTPGNMESEKKKHKASKDKGRYRSAATGRSVSKEFAKANPDTTYRTASKSEKEKRKKK